jgi:hypothetical protein
LKEMMRRVAASSDSLAMGRNACETASDTGNVAGVGSGEDERR